MARTKHVRLIKTGNTIGPSTTPSFRAAQAAYPPICAIPAINFRYFETMSADTRKEAKDVLHDGVQSWEKAMIRIEYVVRSEVKRRLKMFNESIFGGSLSRQTTLSAAEIIEKVELENELRRELKRRRSSILPFPTQTGSPDVEELFSGQLFTGYREDDLLSETAASDAAPSSPGGEGLGASPALVMWKDVDEPDGFDMDCDEDFVYF